jgi:hypothetical protein
VGSMHQFLFETGSALQRSRSNFRPHINADHSAIETGDCLFSVICAQSDEEALSTWPELALRSVV